MRVKKAVLLILLGFWALTVLAEPKPDATREVAKFFGGLGQAGGRKIALVMDCGDEYQNSDSEKLAWRMAEDAKIIAEWIKKKGYKVLRISQYWGNDLPGIIVTSKELEGICRGKYREWRSIPKNTQQTLKGEVARRLLEQRLEGIFRTIAPKLSCCDKFLLYINGHGEACHGKGDFAFFDSEGNYYAVIDYAKLANWLAAFPNCTEITIFVDACYSGSSIRDLEKLRAKHPKLVILTTCDATEKTLGYGWPTDTAVQDFLDAWVGEDVDKDGNAQDIFDCFYSMWYQREQNGKYKYTPQISPQLSQCFTVASPAKVSAIVKALQQGKVNQALRNELANHLKVRLPKTNKVMEPKPGQQWLVAAVGNNDKFLVTYDSKKKELRICKASFGSLDDPPPKTPAPCKRPVFPCILPLEANQPSIIFFQNLCPEFWEYVATGRSWEPLSVSRFCFGPVCSTSVTGGIKGVRFQLEREGTELAPGLKLCEEGAIMGTLLVSGHWDQTIYAVDEENGQVIAELEVQIVVKSELPEEEVPEESPDEAQIPPLEEMPSPPG